ncbi:DNA-invertase hin [compost metagenome]
MTTFAYVRITAAHPSENAQRDEIAVAHHVERWFKDGELDGSTCILELPGFSELFKLVRKGDTVIVSGNECLGSSVPAFLKALKALQKKGVHVMSVQGGDLSAFGRQVFRTLNSIARLDDTVREAR